MANETSRIKDLTAVTTADDTHVLPLDNSNGTKGITFANLSTTMLNKLTSKTYTLDMGTKTLTAALNELYEGHVRDSAGGHNSIYRGKSLGTAYTDAMSTAVTNGTFDDMYIGDYLTINKTVYRIAGFNLIKNCGDNISIGNNVCFVPDSAMYNAQMHNTDSGAYESGSTANDTTGAYALSDMRTTNLATATTTIENDFGSTHVLSYRDVLANAVANGQASGWAWYDCKVELMSEVMVYGTTVWGNSGFEVGCINSQLPLFRLNPESIHRRFYYWLRSVGSATYFALVNNAGAAGYSNASHANGVRPLFFVC